jgi:hypothetical protein
MFLGTAAFYHAIMMARHQVHPTGAKHDLALAMSLGLALFRLMTGRVGSSPLSRAERMTVELDGRGAAPAEYLLFLATTLERLMLGLMPFWGAGNGGLRYTSIGFPPRRLWRALLSSAAGRGHGWRRSGRSGGRTMPAESAMSIVFDGGSSRRSRERQSRCADRRVTSCGADSMSAAG